MFFRGLLGFSTLIVVGCSPAKVPDDEPQLVAQEVVSSPNRSDCYYAKNERRCPGDATIMLPDESDLYK